MWHLRVLPVILFVRIFSAEGICDTNAEEKGFDQVEGLQGVMPRLPPTLQPVKVTGFVTPKASGKAGGAGQQTQKTSRQLQTPTFSTKYRKKKKKTAPSKHEATHLSTPRGFPANALTSALQKEKETWDSNRPQKPEIEKYATIASQEDRVCKTQARFFCLWV